MLACTFVHGIIMLLLLFKEVARRMEIATDDHFTHQHLVQRISVAIQRGNAAAVLGSMGVMGEG